MKNHCYILVFLSLLFGISNVFGWNEVDIVRVGHVVNQSNVIIYDLHVNKVNRTTYAVSGNLEILIESKEADLYRVNVSHLILLKLNKKGKLIY